MRQKAPVLDRTVCAILDELAMNVGLPIYELMPAAARDTLANLWRRHRLLPGIGSSYLRN